MQKGKLAFSHIIYFLPKYEFDKCVKRYNGNYRNRKFSCFDQFLCMSFAQITGRESLRDIENCLGAMRKKLYHAGFRSEVSKRFCRKFLNGRIYGLIPDKIILLRHKIASKHVMSC